MNTNKIWAAIASKAEDDYSALNENERVIYNLRSIGASSASSSSVTVCPTA